MANLMENYRVGIKLPDGWQQLFTPEDDITPYELAACMTLMMHVGAKRSLDESTREAYAAQLWDTTPPEVQRHFEAKRTFTINAGVGKKSVKIPVLRTITLALGLVCLILVGCHYLFPALRPQWQLAGLTASALLIVNSVLLFAASGKRTA